jgi:tetratricopeptide (TPR) repeat protein
VAAQQEGLRLDAMRLADQLANRYPDDIEAAYIQGESGWHFGLSLGVPPEPAIRAFDRVLASDSGSREARLHLPALLWLAGDTARATALAGTGGLMGHLRGSADLTFFDDLPVHDLGSVLEPVVQALLLLDRDPGWGLALADTIAARIRARADIALPLRAQLLLFISHFRLAQGRYQEAWHLLDEAETMGPGAGAFGTLVHSIVTGQRGAEADTVADHLAVLDSTAPWIPRELLLAWHSAETGDSLLFATMERRVDSALKAGPEGAYLFRRLDGLRGIAAFSGGDSASARRLLRSAYEGRYYFREGQSITALRTRLSMLLARLDLAADAPTAALGRLHDTFWLGFVYRAQAEEMRGQIYEQMGDTARAIRAYRNFINLWGQADPELQPRVNLAREALRRLE